MKPSTTSPASSEFQYNRRMASVLPQLGQRPPGKFSASLICLSCHRQPVWTNVEPRISSPGWVWATICFFCGSPWLSLLVRCLDCFREWSHTCPRCGKELAVYSPAPSCGVVTALALISLLTLLLTITAFVGLYAWWMGIPPY